MVIDGYWVYIVTNGRNTVLYTGVTGNLLRRVAEHKLKIRGGFTCDHNANKLVHCERFDRPMDAICREKQIKGWLRRKKRALISANNPL